MEFEIKILIVFYLKKYTSCVYMIYNSDILFVYNSHVSYLLIHSQLRSHNTMK